MVEGVLQHHCNAPLPQYGRYEEDEIAEGLITQIMIPANTMEPAAAIHRNQCSLSNTAKSNTTTEKSRLATFLSMNSDQAA